MAPPRFYVADLPESGTCRPDSTQGKHARSVLRLAAGDVVTLFDGRGGEAEAYVVTSGTRDLYFEIQHRSDTCRESARAIESWVALPKGDRQRTLVDGLVQLGVRRMVPLITERGVAQPTAGAVERLRRMVIESSKQCGRNRLMEVCEPMRVPDMLTHATAMPQDAARWFAHPYGKARPLAELPLVSQTPVAFCVGPEGGLTDAEVTQLVDAGWSQVSLGPRVLRVEMAALLLAGWLSNQPEAGRLS